MEFTGQCLQRALRLAIEKIIQPLKFPHDSPDLAGLGRMDFDEVHDRPAGTLIADGVIPAIVARVDDRLWRLVRKGIEEEATGFARVSCLWPRVWLGANPEA